MTYFYTVNGRETPSRKIHAALAHYYAGQGMKTILISSDPAHSTDETVGVKISSTAQEISPNLWRYEYRCK